MRWIQSDTLKAYFRRHAIRWSLISFILVVMASLPAFLWTIKSGSEKHLLSLAQIATFSFRPQIISTDASIREAQTQMIDAVKLKPEESIVIRDKNLKRYFDDGTDDVAPMCIPPRQICWTNHFRQIEHLEPVYFDGGEKVLKGYVDFRMKPTVDHSSVFVFLVFLLLIFLTQAIGLSSALDRASFTITEKLSQWAKKVRKPSVKENFLSGVRAPFQEFQEMQMAIDGLKEEISRLQDIAVEEAKTKLQLSVLQGIGHDLRTPISQVEKNFAVLVSSTRRTGILDPDKIATVERTLNKVKGVSRQVKMFQDGLSSEVQICTISDEAETLYNDMKDDADVLDRNIKLHFEADPVSLPSKISPVAFQRIFENLVRNAIDAVAEGGIVKVKVGEENHHAVLIVEDNGHGFSEDLKDEIFENAYTTKDSTGMGLGIVRGLCIFYDAKIETKSAPNEGAHFKILFSPVGEAGVAV